MNRFWKLMLVVVLVSVSVGAVAYAQTHPFEDVPESGWKADAVSHVNALELMNGCSTTEFCGDRPLTRYELAAVIDRLVVLMADQDQIAHRTLYEVFNELVRIDEDLVSLFSLATSTTTTTVAGNRNTVDATDLWALRNELSLLKQDVCDLTRVQRFSTTFTQC